MNIEETIREQVTQEMIYGSCYNNLPAMLWYSKLPWYRRLFTRRPRPVDPRLLDVLLTPKWLRDRK